MQDLKALLIVCDGLGDRPLRQLGWKTPLENVETPHLDKLSQRGISGLMDVLSPGIPPGSDTGHLAILGYDPVTVYKGRGAFEAIGAGLNVLRGDVAFRCNFATVNESMVVVDRRAGRIGTEEAKELAAALASLRVLQYPDVEVFYEATTEHRGAMILRGPGLSASITDSDPEEENRGVPRVEAVQNTNEAKKTANILNELTKFSYRVLDKHPVNERRRRKGQPVANILLSRGAGQLPDIPSLTEKYKIRASCIVTNALVKGVAISAGMSFTEVPGATGTIDSNLDAKAKAAITNLEHDDFVFLHVKGADNASHDGNLEQKLEMIRKIDRMVGVLTGRLQTSEIIIAITADHATPVIGKHHTGDPVPVLISGEGVVQDGVQRFAERYCLRGGLGRIRGVDLMPIVMNLIGKTKKFGA